MLGFRIIAWVVCYEVDFQFAYFEIRICVTLSNQALAPSVFRPLIQEVPANKVLARWVLGNKPQTICG